MQSGTRSLRPLPITLALLALSISGCLGEHKVALGPASMPVDARLMGAWRCLPFSAEDPDVVVPLRFEAEDATHYEISLPCGAGQDACHFRTHLTLVGHSVILNAQAHDEKKADDGWLYARYTLHGPDLLHLELVDDEHVFAGVTESTDAFRRTLVQKLKNPKTFLDYLVCVRVQAKPTESPEADPALDPEGSPQ